MFQLIFTFFSREYNLKVENTTLKLEAPLLFLFPPTKHGDPPDGIERVAAEHLGRVQVGGVQRVVRVRRLDGPGRAGLGLARHHAREGVVHCNW